MTEPARSNTVQLDQREAAILVTRLSVALDEVTQLLVVAADVHRRLAGLQSALTEPLVDLERLLRAHTEPAPTDEPPLGD
jgi:hypothetical protein